MQISFSLYSFGYLVPSSGPGTEVQFSHSVMSNSLRPHGLQHARTPVHHKLLEFTQTHIHWVGDTDQPPHPLSFPSLPTFNLSQYQGLFKHQFFASSGQSIRDSASASVLLMNIQDWFPLGWTRWISLQSKEHSRVFFNFTVQKASILWCLAFCIVQLSHVVIYDSWKNHNLD